MADIKLTWTIPTVDDEGAPLALIDVLSWDIHRDGVFVANMLRTTAGPGVTYTDAGQAPGTYDYTVFTLTTNGTSEVSNVTQEVVPSGIAAAVTDLTSVIL